jgi:hypothetical protein
MMDCNRIKVSRDRSHHVVDGRAMYSARYDEVLAFHSPGLAAVRRGDEAWHIDTEGNATYAARYLRTFGFYEGRAAVIAPDGWMHVRADGRPLYAERFSWCGNYQDGRCTVRDRDGRYLHLDLEGRPAYEHRWKYAGDFRDDYAVVQRDDGRCTHIDRDGVAVHGIWFEDLDVFHKGLARARDEAGWTHVDPAGTSRYARRFAAVEPFYNGQARVDAFDGSRLVVGEDGETLLTLKPPRGPLSPVERKAATAGMRLASALSGPDEIAGNARTVAGRYLVDLEQPLVRSVNGALYRAWDQRVERPVLIKSRRGASFSAREEHILRSLSGLPVVPALWDALTVSESRWLVLEPLPGHGIGSRARCDVLPVDDALACADSVLTALEALHALGFVHGDVHPLNVLRHPGTRRSWLVDFELAVPLDDTRSWEGEIYWGLWEYVPPEQLQPFARLDPSSDTYAVAALLFALLSGRPPFKVDLRAAPAEDWEGVRRHCLLGRAALPSFDRLPESCRSLVEAGLSLDPTGRFRDATTMRKAVDEARRRATGTT